MKTALLSAYQKEGIDLFAHGLIELGWSLLASGGTARHLRDRGIEVQDIAEIVGGTAILGHRVVTLSREIHAGLLARDTPEDHAELQRLGIPWIGLVYVNLYPLEGEIQRQGSTRESVIEMTDIGGPTLLRSAAKGRRIVLCDPEDAVCVLEWLKMGGPDHDQMVNNLAAKAEAVVGRYCMMSACYHSDEMWNALVGYRVQELKYGENPWQIPASFYTANSDDPLSIDKMKLVQGGPLGFVNLVDVDRLLQTMSHISIAFMYNFDKNASITVAVKHGNACGVAVDSGPTRNLVALEKMINGDPRALFGGFVMTNFLIGEAEAKDLCYYLTEGKKRLLHGVVAPDFTDRALGLMKSTTGSWRCLVNSRLASPYIYLDQAPRLRTVRGGFLVQPNYTYILSLQSEEIEKSSPLVPQQREDMVLAWAIGSTSTSNTITLVKDGMLIGNGVGQQDRVTAAELAVQRAREAGHDTQGAVAYSDSFFPFTDGPKILADAGVTAILASSGSVNDDQVRVYCKERGVALWFVPDKTGRGFYGH